MEVKHIERYDLPSGGRFLKIPYHADPAKDRVWLAAVEKEMADTPVQFRREILMDDTESEGQIYSCFKPEFRDDEGLLLPPKTQKVSSRSREFNILMRGPNVCDPFRIPVEWLRSSGHDFGPKNTAAVFAAQDPVSCKVYIHRTYHAGDKTLAEHVEQFIARANTEQDPRAWGGARSEDKTRVDYAKHNWPIERPPIWELLEGIQRVFTLIRTGLLVVFSDLAALIADLQSYQWELTDLGEPIEGKILDKDTWHRLDALRYLCAAIYEGLVSVIEALDRDRHPGDPITYDDEEEMYNPYKHLGWTLTAQGWVQTDEEEIDDGR